MWILVCLALSKKDFVYHCRFRFDEFSNCFSFCIFRSQKVSGEQNEGGLFLLQKLFLTFFQEIFYLRAFQLLKKLIYLQALLFYMLHVLNTHLRGFLLTQKYHTVHGLIVSHLHTYAFFELLSKNILYLLHLAKIIKSVDHSVMIFLHTE
jgi:hypothetical protein